MNGKTTITNFKIAPRTPDMSVAQFQRTFAYVYADNKSHSIHVGPRFWKVGETGADSTADTLIHEMSHFAGTGPTIPKSNPSINRALDGYVDPQTGRP